MTYKNNINYNEPWESKRVNNFKINSIYTSNYLLNLCVDEYDTSKIRLKFNGSFLHVITPSINHGE